VKAKTYRSTSREISLQTGFSKNIPDSSTPLGNHHFPFERRKKLMPNERINSLDFTVDQNNLYREENITDFKVASIRRMIPINPDGTKDKSRKTLYVGGTQLMSPDGPVPLQAKLQAETIQEAMEVFPEAMKKAMAEMIEELKKMHQQQKDKQDSRIFVPGR
jgi:hypothetical protein